MVDFRTRLENTTVAVTNRSGPLDSIREIQNQNTQTIPQNRNQTGARIFSPSQNRGKRLNLRFIPNQLSELDSYTYRIKLFMISENLFINPNGVTKELVLNSLLSNSGIILCETGSTSFNIESFRINNLVQINYNFSTPVTGFEMNVVEPLGISFIDSIFDAARLLGVSNPLKCPMFIYLEFIGMQGEKSGIQQFSYGSYPGLRDVEGYARSWLWNVLITNIDVDYSAGGTKYKISFLETHDFAKMNSILMNRSHRDIQGLIKFGDFLAKLENRLNQDFKNERHTIKFEVIPYNNIENFRAEFGEVKGKEYEDSRKRSEEIGRRMGRESGNDPEGAASVYGEELRKESAIQERISRFGATLSNIDPDPRNWQIVPKENRNYNSASMQNAQETTSVRSARHEDIVSYILEVLNTTDEAIALREALKGKKEVNWSVRFICDIREYVKERKAYAYDIKVIIEPKETSFPVLINNGEPIKLSVNDTLEELTKLNEINALVKRYDYFFTGRNTEVLNLDLNLNNFWSAAIAFSDSNITLGDVSPSQNITEEQVLQTKTTSSLLDQGSNVAQEANRISENIRTGALRTVDDFRNRLAQAREAAINVINRAVGGITSGVNEFGRSIEERLAGLVGASPGNRFRIADLIDDQAKNQLRTIRSRAGLPPANYIELLTERRQVADEDRLIISTVPEFFDSRSNLRSVEIGGGETYKKYLAVAEILNNNKTPSNLLQIDIKIRGDPYWLGFDSFDTRRIRDIMKSNAAPYNVSSIQFYLSVGFPESFESVYGNGGFINQYNNYFNGFYMAYQVENVFDNGIFTQTIKGTRMIKYDLRGVII